MKLAKKLDYLPACQKKISRDYAVIRVYDEAGNAIETHEHSLLPNGAMLLRNSLSNIAFIWSSERRKACRPCRA